MTIVKRRLNLLDYEFPALKDELARWGFSEYYADLLWRYLYRSRVEDIGQMLDLHPDLLSMLMRKTTVELPTCVFTQESADGTRKVLLSLNDHDQVETVLMPYRDRYTVCISTQAGCAMGCVFCATGQMGFRRHLTAGEIVAQVLFAMKLSNEQSESRQLRNVVMMGMGEPLHNYDATVKAIRILTSDTGLAIGPRYITLSTVGLVPAIERLANEDLGINLAVSLHGSTDTQRNVLVPLGRRWSLAKLMRACRVYSKKQDRRIFFEWTLIAGKNDSPAQAHALGRLLKGIDSHVNLIPLNPTRDFDGLASQSASVTHFKEILAGYDIPSTVRQRRGIDIDAGCGQLRQRTASGANVPTSNS